MCSMAAARQLQHCRVSLLQVLRFDPPATALEFIQSRGRARAPHSRMVLMAEAGNKAHARLIQDVRKCAPARATRTRHSAPLLR